MLTKKQKETCLRVLENYKDGKSRSKPGGMTFEEWDKKREEVGSEIEDLIEQYLQGQLELEDFKWQIDSMNKRNNLWGFDAWQGTFYFNMMLKHREKFDLDFEELLKNSISEPKNDEEAIAKIRRLHNEVEEVAYTFEAKTPRRFRLG